MQAFDYVLRTGSQRKRLPTELGFGSGVTVWRRVRVHADNAYDFPRRRFLSQRDIRARIARRGVESSTRLGRHR